VPAPTKPNDDVTQLMSSTTAAATPASQAASGKQPTGATICATGPTMERIPSFHATDPGLDATQVMSAILQDGGSACSCGCGGHGEKGERPFGLPPLSVTLKAKDARKELREQLVASVTALLRLLNAAHLAGSIAPGDLEMLQALQGWYSELQAEQDLAKRKK
jgi:hypothetical protein